MGGIIGSNISRSRRRMNMSRPFVGGKMDVFPRLWSNPDRFFKLAPYRGCILIVDDPGHLLLRLVEPSRRPSWYLASNLKKPEEVERVEVGRIRAINLKYNIVIVLQIIF